MIPTVKSAAVARQSAYLVAGGATAPPAAALEAPRQKSADNPLLCPPPGRLTMPVGLLT